MTTCLNNLSFVS